ncbi:MAG: nucleotidyltransferase domain-containing protein [Candidatus Helarchaeales archaeon]
MGSIDDREIKEILGEFCIQLQREFDKNVKIILFGSRAKKNHLKSSDVDLLIISNKFKNVSFRNRILNIVKHWSETRILLEPICVTPEEYQNRKEKISIIREAEKTGIPIN